ncbi:MAG: hypothetical protein A2W91_04995 [Bacteroidetes bacterium GWF2_38_335]|nr:MAG: hypothetical protein A2W91_04995 [Bacteroidetes bacterium GWF2_38_335]OFY79812.1 MAG: hypothetical protein A2281_10425 [Bacteroidetes bacterium RIFOXYA12_FULL_38_20]HBS88201.1 hypothetical protein [Bacteroidales bacterium]
MNGNYTIGGTSPDFTDFTTAVNYLNNNGVDGPVIFNVRPGTYVEHFIINFVTGSSSVNTIAFQSEEMDSNSVILQYATTSTENYVIYLAGAQFINFNHLTIKTTSTSNYQIVISVSNGSSNNIFSNNVIRSNVISGISSAALILINGGGDNNSITENLFVNGGYQIKIIGMASDYCINNNIIRNVFSGTAGYSIYAQLEQDISISGNNINCNLYNSSSGIRFVNCGGLIYLEKNILCFGGTLINIVEFNDCNGSLINPIIFKNNFVSATSGSYIRCIVLYNVSFVKIINNSFNFNVWDSYIIEFAIGLSNIDLFNNIFNWTHGGSFYASSNSIDTSQIHSDYNVFYSSGNIKFLDDDNYMTFDEWRFLKGQDNNSLITNPFYISNTDLHVNNAIEIMGKALPIIEVNEDIDGDLRDVFHPDIGADEFEINYATFHDIELIEILYPDTNIYLPIDSIKIRVKNNSIFDIDSFNVKFLLFDLLQYDGSVIKNIHPGDTVTVDLGPFDYIKNTYYEFEFEISNPNGNIDNYFENNEMDTWYYYLNDVEIFKRTNDCNDEIELFIKNFPKASVLWSNGSTDNRIIVTSPGSYSVIVTGDNGNQVTDTIIVY